MEGPEGSGDTGLLIAFGGLPATGKTTLARALAQRLGAGYLRIDTIEQALRSHSAATDPGAAGYGIAFRVAADNLNLGGPVVADSVNPLRITRDAWLAVADQSSAKIVEVEVICSDSVHRSGRRAKVRYRWPEASLLARHIEPGI
jgi:predicted kinase